jgi:hypothetical protein
LLIGQQILARDELLLDPEQPLRGVPANISGRCVHAKRSATRDLETAKLDDD